MKLRFLILFSLFLGPELLAQSQSDTIVYKLKPVTVTATRTSQPWIKVPFATTSVDLSGPQSGKGYGLDELLSGVPGVLAQSRSGNQDIRLTIRGYGARGAGERSNSGTTRGIRVLMDGFPETEPDGRTSFDLIDLSGAGSIEVVRSNASSLWGNASGGVVSIRSNSTFDTPYASLHSSFASYGFHKESFRVGTMIDAGRFFLSLNNTTSEGWRSHSSSAQTLLSTGVVSQLGDRTSLGVYLAATSNLFRIPGPLTQQQFNSLPRQSDSVYIRRDERRINRIGRLGVALSHDLNSSNSFSASTFINSKALERSERNRYRDFTRYHVGGSFTYKNHSSFSESFDNNFLIGIDEAYQDGAIRFYNVVNGNRGTSLRANKREGANTFGVFLQEEATLHGRLTALVGVRYDNVTYSYDDFIDPKLNDSKSFERVTPKFGISYRFSPTQSIYANVGGGVEVPAGNEVDPVPTFGIDTVRALNPLLEPITSTTIEVGTKQIIAFGETERVALLTYDAALYWLEVRNDIIPYDNGAFFLTAGKTRRMGIELGSTLSMHNGLSFSASLTGSANEYQEYIVDSVHYGKPGASADISGKDAAGIPEFFYSISAQFTPSALQGLFARVSVQGVGAYFADDRNQYAVPSYNTLSAAIGIDRYRISGGQWYVSGSLGVNNITDRNYVASAWINPLLNTSNQPVYIEPGLPRNIVGSLSLGMNF